MTDVELLPLPEWCQGCGESLPRDMQAYARANVEHHTAPLQAENERLRAEVEDYRTNGAAAVRFAPVSAHWSNELRRLFGDDARAGIEVLERRYQKELARADRLADALREAEEHINALTPEWYSAGQRLLAAIRAALRDHDQEDRYG